MEFRQAMDSFVFPTAVGPVRTTSGFFLFCITDIIFSLLFLSCYPLFWVQFAASMAMTSIRPSSSSCGSEKLIVYVSPQ